jgi:hypothetical protein
MQLSQVGANRSNKEGTGNVSTSTTNLNLIHAKSDDLTVSIKNLDFLRKRRRRTVVEWKCLMIAGLVFVLFGGAGGTAYYFISSNNAKGSTPNQELTNTSSSIGFSSSTSLDTTETSQSTPRRTSTSTARLTSSLTSTAIVRSTITTGASTTNSGPTATTSTTARVITSSATRTSNTASTTSGGPTPSTLAPGQFMDLKRWKLTLPIGRNEKPTEIRQPALTTYIHPDYFRMNPSNDAVSFVAFANGTSTSGSNYPRR